jgi:Lon protease-like protein
MTETTERAEMAMFPLGSVLLPSLYLPLHVFEPRYRALVQDCLAGEREFGVVLIARGSEVGGGDQRTDVGTVARILEAVEMPDGRWGIGAVGVRRIRVVAWLPDDPYPRAEVVTWEDPQPEAGYVETLARTIARLRRVLARAAEMGDAAAPATQELADDPVLAGYQAAALSGSGPADLQRLLEQPTPDARLDLLERLLADEEADLTRRLELASDPEPPEGFPDAGPPDGA